MLASVLDRLGTCPGDGPRVVDPELDRVQGRPVDPLHPDRPEPVVAAHEFERRGGGRRRQLVAEPARSDGSPSPSRGSDLSAVRSRSRTASGIAGVPRPIPPDRRAARPGSGTAQPEPEASMVRQVGPDLHRERLVAGGQEPVSIAQAAHRPGKSSAASARSSPRSHRATLSLTRRSGPAPGERDRDEQHDEQGEGPQYGPPPVPVRFPVCRGQRLARLADGQSDQRGGCGRPFLDEQLGKLEDIGHLLPGPGPEPVERHCHRQVIETRGVDPGSDRNTRATSNPTRLMPSKT